MKDTKQITNFSMDAPLVAVDAVIFSILEKSLKVLLVRIGSGPYEGKWALPGGLVKTDESLEEAAERVLSEKAGVHDLYLEQLYAFGDVDRDSRGRSVSVAYFALVNKENHLAKDVEYYSGIEWFDVSKLPEMAFDHAKIIQAGLDRLRNKLGYSNIAYGLLPKEFTLTELQTVYEIILGRALDKRNFRKKLLEIKLVHETGNVRRMEQSRPARLYSFTHHKLEIVDVL